MNLRNSRLRIGLALFVGVVSGLVLAETATAQGGFKSKFQRRVVGDTELTGSIDASLLPGDVLPKPGEPPRVLAANPGSDDSDAPTGILGSAPPSDQTSGTAEVPPEPVTKEEKLAALNALIEQQEKNIELMQKELADAQREKRNPDPKKLKQLATATGQRTKAYQGQTKFAQNLIDRFEKEANNKTHAGMLALGMAMGKLWQTHYKIEIIRSKDFINLVKSEQAKLQ